MPKKQTTKQRTKVKDLPKKEKKLNTEDMKKVKGGAWYAKFDGVDGSAVVSTKPLTTK